MIICTKKSVIEDAEVTVEKTTYGYRVTTQAGFDFEFDSRLIESVPDVMFLNKDAFGNPAFTWFSESANCRDGYLSSRIRKRIYDPMAMCVAVIAIDALNEVHIYTFGKTHIVDDLPCIEVGMSFDPDSLAFGKSSTDVIAEFVPSVTKFIKHQREKQLAIGKISETESLAGLEAQVDLLTKGMEIVMSLVPQESRPAWWEDFKQAVFPIASVDYGNDLSIQSAIDTVRQQKESIRLIQSQYFAKVKAIYDN